MKLLALQKPVDIPETDRWFRFFFQFLAIQLPIFFFKNGRPVLDDTFHLLHFQEASCIEG